MQTKCTLKISSSIVTVGGTSQCQKLNREILANGPPTKVLLLEYVQLYGNHRDIIIIRACIIGGVPVIGCS